VVDAAQAVVGGSGRCWAEWVEEGEAGGGAAADLVEAAGVVAVLAGEDLADSAAVAAVAVGPPVVGERGVDVGAAEE
jgi:hypothetical protein